MNAEAWYAYAVMAAGHATPAVPPILPGAALAALPAGEVAVLASPVPRALFDREAAGNRTGEPGWIAERAQAHHGVVAAAAPCLPFAFGALFSGLAPLLDWAEERQSVLAEALRRLGQRDEWSLILREDAAQHAAYLQRTEPTLSELARKRDGAGPGTAFLLTRRLEQLLPAARSARLAALRAQMQAVAGQCDLDPQPEPRPERLTILADTATIAAARPALETLGDSLSGTGVALELSGPWPAYGFARAALERPE